MTPRNRMNWKFLHSSEKRLNNLNTKQALIGACFYAIISKLFSVLLVFKGVIMKMRGVDFHYAFDQSGVRNFDGKGWPYHKYFRPLGLTFKNCSPVAKTTTLHPRLGKAHNQPGNMALEEDGMTPVDAKPDCIHVGMRGFLHGVGLNAVGLSGPGLLALLQKSIWYEFHEPFMISVMTLEATRAARLKELEEMVGMIRPFLPFRTKFGVQLNLSCPNVSHEKQATDETVAETRDSLAILRELGDKVVLVPKINTKFPILAALEIAQDPNCDGLCNSNTISWADVPEKDRMRLFGTIDSPLAKYGGGGVSGSYLLPKVRCWIRTARAKGLAKPIIAGGGVLHPHDVDALAEDGASAIAVGSVAFLRPWRMQRIINRANELGARGAFYKQTRLFT